MKQRSTHNTPVHFMPSTCNSLKTRNMHTCASVDTGIMRQKKSVIAIGLVLILSVIGVLVHRLAFAKETTTYRFATIERGNLQSTVSATGTLNAVTTVSVGTQVSGQVSQLFVDFNDQVKKGQLLARIDPTLAQQ